MALSGTSCASRSLSVTAFLTVIAGADRKDHKLDAAVEQPDLSDVLPAPESFEGVRRSAVICRGFEGASLSAFAS